MAELSLCVSISPSEAKADSPRLRGEVRAVGRQTADWPMTHSTHKRATLQGYAKWFASVQFPTYITKKGPSLRSRMSCRPLRYYTPGKSNIDMDLFFFPNHLESRGPPSTWSASRRCSLGARLLRGAAVLLAVMGRVWRDRKSVV